MQKVLKKIIPYIFILTILVGIFGFGLNVNAQDAPPLLPSNPVPGAGGTTTPPTTGATTPTQTTPNTGVPCTGISQVTGYPIPSGCDQKTLLPGNATAPKTNQENDVLYDNLKNCSSIIYGDFDGCIEKLFYFLFYAIPSFLLTYAAYFFNSLVALSLNSTLIGESTFIKPAWAIVRDLSNIFFIIILLYIAIQTILGIGGGGHGGGPKKTITMVIVMALLINFSMFFTKIVIDSSNILALVFYNKIDVVEKKPDGTIIPRPYIPITKFEEKDIAGGMVKAFNPTHLLSQDFYDALKRKGQVVPAGYTDAALVTGLALTPSPFFLTQIGAVLVGGHALYGSFIGFNDIPMPVMLALILISGLLMGFAAYAFFVTGLAFLSRVIELWILIIFSPFAFMSSTIPLLEHIEFLGWDAWLKRLISVSFMAPIFMFFMYFIFLLVNANIFDNLKLQLSEETIAQTILFIFIPAITILMLLLQATKFAKKGAGEIGSAVSGFVSGATALIGGLSLGAGSMLLQRSVGKYGSQLASSTWLNKNVKEGKFGAATLQKLADYSGNASFDARKGAAGVALSGISAVTGLNLGHESKLLTRDGGYNADRKKAVEKAVAKASRLKVFEDEELTQELRKNQIDRQELFDGAEHHVKEIERDIEGAEADRQRFQNEANSIDTTDPVKLAEKNAKIAEILANINLTATEQQAELAKANSMSTTDDEKVAKKNAALAKANKETQKINKLKGKRSEWKNGKVETKDENGSSIINQEDGTTVYNTHNGRITAGQVKSDIEDATAAVEAFNLAQQVSQSQPANDKLKTVAAAAKKNAEEAIKKATKSASEVKKLALRSDASDEIKNAAKIAEDTTTNISQAFTTNNEQLLNTAKSSLESVAKATKAAAKKQNGLGRSLNDLDDIYIPNSEHEIHHETVERQVAFRDRMASSRTPWGMNITNMGDNELREALYKIRMNASKPHGDHDSHGKEHGGGHNDHGTGLSEITHAIAAVASAFSLSGGGSHGGGGGGKH